MLEKIIDGETYEVCLTNMLEAEMEVDTELDSLGMYLALRATTRPRSVPISSPGKPPSSAPRPNGLCAITADGRIESKPIKGTRARGATESEDAEIRDELLRSEKDRSENLMIVDLVRHDLGASAQLGSVSVDELFGIESYATVHQMVSTVSAVLDREFPGGVCPSGLSAGVDDRGAESCRTMSIIDEMETGPRGVYSGGIGYFSLNGAVDLSVVIRTLVIWDDPFNMGSVVQSLPSLIPRTKIR